MFDYFIIYIILAIIIGVSVIFGIARIASSVFLNKKRLNNKQGPFSSLTLSREDAVAQLFFLLSVLFFFLAFLIFNKNVGQIISWQTILLISTAVAVFVAYNFKAFYVFLLSLFGICLWWIAQNIRWFEESADPVQSTYVVTGLIFIFLIFYVLGRIHEINEKFKRLSLSYLFLSVVPIVGIFFILSTQMGLSLFQEMTRGTIFFFSWQMALSLFILIAVFIAVLAYAILNKSLIYYELSAIIIIGLIFLIIAILPEQNLFYRYSYYLDSSLSATGVFWALIFNLISFAGLTGIILLGYIKKEEWFINLGAFILLLFILVKYFDWFFKFLNKSIFFIGAGILLFVVGWLMERGRKKMISNIKNQPEIKII